MHFNSPGLSAIFNEIKHSDRNHILDLGEMRANTFQFFSAQSCKFHFENLREFLIQQNDESRKHFQTALNDYLTTFSESHQFDVILLWDLINYLSIDQLAILLEKIKPHCKENTLVYSLTYIAKKIPDTPSRFQINTHDSIDIEIIENATREKSLITSSMIVKRLPEFMLETNLFNTTTIESGIVENLLRFTPNLKHQEKNLIKNQYSYEKKTYQSETQSKATQSLTHHASPGLIYFIKYLQKHKRTKVLNLGKDIIENNNLLTKHIGQITAEDLSCRYSEYGFKLGPHTLKFSDNKKFDGILLWDFLNQLDKSTVQEIYYRLIDICQPGTLIYIINFSKQTQKPLPGHYYIQNNGHLKFQAKPSKSDQDENTTTPLSTANLLKVFNNMRIKKSFVLLPGMARGVHEIVLECL